MHGRTFILGGERVAMTQKPLAYLTKNEQELVLQCDSVAAMSQIVACDKILVCGVV